MGSTKLNGHTYRAGLPESMVLNGPPTDKVDWIIQDRKRMFFVIINAQTAYEAWRASLIQRNGVPLSFSECEVYLRKV